MNPQGSIQKSPLTYAFLVSYHSSPLLVKIQYYPYITIIYYPNNTHIISYYPSILYIYIYTLHNILSIYLYTHILSITMCSYILSMLYPCYIPHLPEEDPQLPGSAEGMRSPENASGRGPRGKLLRYTMPRSFMDFERGNNVYKPEKLLEGASGFSTKSRGLIWFT